MASSFVLATKKLLPSAVIFNGATVRDCCQTNFKQDDVNFPVKLRNIRACPLMTSQWASPSQWREPEWTYKNPRSRSTWRTSSRFLSGLKRNTEPLVPRDQRKSSTHDLTAISPSVDELPTANEVTTRKESQSYRMSGFENLSILGKSPPFLNRSPPRDVVGEGRLLAMLVLAKSFFFWTQWAVIFFFVCYVDIVMSTGLISD